MYSRAKDHDPLRQKSSIMVSGFSARRSSSMSNLCAMTSGWKIEQQPIHGSPFRVRLQYSGWASVQMEASGEYQWFSSSVVWMPKRSPRREHSLSTSGKALARGDSRRSQP